MLHNHKHDVFLENKSIHTSYGMFSSLVYTAGLGPGAALCFITAICQSNVGVIYTTSLDDQLNSNNEPFNIQSVLTVSLTLLLSHQDFSLTFLSVQHVIT